MPDCTAPGCSRPVTDAYVCPGCASGLSEHLRELAGVAAADGPGPARDAHGQPLPGPDHGLLADVLDTMCRLDVAEPDTTRPPETPAGDDPDPTDEPIAAHRHPVHEGAAQILADAARLLDPWVGRVAYGRYGALLDGHARDRAAQKAGCAGPWRPPLPFRWPDPSTAARARWIALYPSTVAQHPDGGQLVGRVASLVRRGRDVVAPRASVYLGWCEQCHERDPDTAVVDLYADPQARHVACPRCGSVHDIATRRRELLARAGEQWETAPVIARGLTDYVRDAYTETMPDGSRRVSDRHRPLTAQAIHGHGDRGRLTRWTATRSERRQAERDGRRPPQPRYLVGEVMRLVDELAAARTPATR